jgi:hypothetical protein
MLSKNQARIIVVCAESIGNDFLRFQHRGTNLSRSGIDGNYLCLYNFSGTNYSDCGHAWEGGG